MGISAAVTLGFALPVVLVLASKSSPLLLAVSAAFAVMSVLVAGRGRDLADIVRAAIVSPLGIAVLCLLGLMAASIVWAHSAKASLNQFVQLGAVLAGGLALGAALPIAAPRRRALLFAAGAAAASLVIVIDLKTGMQMRELTGGLAVTYRYNRSLVTLTILIWPLLALIAASGKLWLVAPLAVLLPLALWAGESGAAVMAAAAGVLIFPIAALLPRLAMALGLGGTLALLAVQPWFGSLMHRMLGQTFHKTLESAHSGDRVDIWLSFEAAVRANWLLGNGFGSSLNMDKSPVAALVPPDRVTLLGASHPHNGFLQLWVELGLTGALLAAVIITLLFRAIARLRPSLRPFALTCFGVAALVNLVSHGAWQAWWWAALLAAVGSFAVLEAELRRGEPPL